MQFCTFVVAFVNQVGIKKKGLTNNNIPHFGVNLDNRYPNLDAFLENLARSTAIKPQKTRIKIVGLGTEF